MFEWLRSVASGHRRPARRGSGPFAATYTGYGELARKWRAPRGAKLFAKVIVRPRTAGQFALFEQAVREVAEIMSAHRLADSGDYLLEIERDELLPVEEVKQQLLAGLPGYVDCEIAVVARTAVDGDVFIEAAVGAARHR